MKNNKISPGQIPHLVRLTAEFFRTMDKEIAYSPNRNEKANQMHFVVDLLKDLVDTAYPIKAEIKVQVSTEPTITENDVDKSLYEAFLALMKIGGLPQCSIPTFQEWKKEVKKMEGER